MNLKRTNSAVPIPDLPERRPAPRRRFELPGFSLIVTVALLLLISMIAVGLLSLSIVAVRSTGAQSDITEARDNARLAMLLALGEVQKTLGPDKGAAGPASMVHENPAEPHLAGVWETWSWNPTARRSNVPSAADIREEKAERFRGWLASDPAGPERRLDPAFPVTGPDDPVLLVGPGSAVQGGHDLPAEVRGGFVPVQADGGGTGARGFAWAVLQEDVKAHVQPGAGGAPAAGPRQLAACFAPGESGLGALEMTAALAAERAMREKTISTSTLSLSGDDPELSRLAFHHLSPYPLGVPGNAAQGGMRQDLTTIFEDFDASALSGERVYSNPATARGGDNPAPWWSSLADYYNVGSRIKDGGGPDYPLDIDPDLEKLRTFNTANNEAFNPKNPRSLSGEAPEHAVLAPVVAKVDIVFSLVTHDVDDSQEGQGTPWWYDQADHARSQDPQYEHYMPWLVFEPLVTLWNPYNVPVRFSEVKLFIDRIPVGFRFFKHEHTWAADKWVDVRRQTDSHTAYWRPLHSYLAGGWNPNSGAVIGDFFIRLQGGGPDTAQPERSLTLAPGETRILTPWIYPGSTWGEIKDLFMIERNYRVRDIVEGRGFGVPYVGGWNRVGGFQFSHLAEQGSWRRNPESLYPYENAACGHLVVLRGPDSFRGQIRLINPDQPDNDPSADNDINRSFSMRVALMSSDAKSINDSDSVFHEIKVEAEDFYKLYEAHASKIIQHDIVAEEAYQAPDDQGPGGKSPFAVLSLTAKPTNDLLHPTKGWLFCNPVTAGATVDEEEGPYSVQSYEMSFREIFSDNSFPMVDVDVNTETRGYFGPGQTSELGLTAATMYSLPSEPMVSIGQFQTANLLGANAMPLFNCPVGNSHAHPLIPSGEVRRDRDGLLDHCHALNWRLWDGFYFSTLSEDAAVKAAEFASGQTPLNSRLLYHAPHGLPKEVAVERMTTGDPDLRARRVATHQMIRGAFNVNSTSVTAWRAVLASLRDHPVPTRDDNEQRDLEDDSSFPRFVCAMTENDETMAMGGGAGNAGAEAGRANRWVGLHRLADDEITLLAEEIVRQIKLRGLDEQAPIHTLAEFVNRRPGGHNDLHALKGLLQTAIEESGVSAPANLEDGIPIALTERVPEPAALEDGNTAEGCPAALLQGDILQEIGAFLTTHSDTLRIRAYGRAGNPGKPTEAWCEAIIQRVPEYVDPGDLPEDTPASGSVNERFGRRFHIVSFRWLSPDEI